MGYVASPWHVGVEAQWEVEHHEEPSGRLLLNENLPDRPSRRHRLLVMSVRSVP